MMRVTYLIALFWLGLPLIARADLDQKTLDLITRNHFGNQWDLPPELSPERIERLLTQFSAKTYGTAFRYLGEAGDFFHGHLLYTGDKLLPDGRLYPLAILYHTQETASPVHWGTSEDRKYDYLDVKTRNWVQWLDADPSLDGTRIENARAYFLAASPEELKPFFEDTVPVRERHYTVSPQKIDPKKFGYQLEVAVQFEFYLMECGAPACTDPHERGPIEVLLPDGQRKCLRLRTPQSSAYFLKAPALPNK